MNREDIEKLLGGYATDSLTAEERAALFAAALEDQDLFDQLAREESLHQVLRDRGARAELLAALESRAEPWYRRFARWMSRPAGLASAAAALAALTVAIVVNHQLTQPKPVAVAEVRAPSGTYMAPRSQAPPAPAERADEAFPTQPHRASGTPEPATAERANPVSPAVRERPSPAPRAAESATAERPEPLLAARRAPEAEKELAKAGPAVAPPAAPAGGGGQAGGVAGGIVNAPRAEGLGAGPLPSAAARQKDANEMRAEADAAVPRAMQATPAMDARALFHAAPFESSFAPRREEAESKTSAESAPAVGQSRAGEARMRMAAPRAANVEPAAAITPVPAPYLGLRYRVLRRDPEGVFSAVDPDTVFRSGDQVRVVFEPNDAGYLYLFERGATGAWRVLASERMERLAGYQVPRTGAMREEEPGVRRLYAVFSRRADPALAGVDPAALEARLGASLRRQKPGDRQDRTDRAAYVVSTSEPLQSQQVAVEVTLTVR